MNRDVATDDEGVVEEEVARCRRVLHVHDVCVTGRMRPNVEMSHG